MPSGGGASGARGRREGRGGGSSAVHSRPMGPPSADAPLFAAAGRPALVARVALPIAVDELFDYAVPAELDAAARPGCRVRVRLGRRTVVGVIAERPEAARYEGELRPIEELLDAEPAIQASLLAVLREEAAELLCP